jgi:hypothetical protein
MLDAINIHYIHDGTTFKWIKHINEKSEMIRLNYKVKPNCILATSIIKYKSGRSRKRIKVIHNPEVKHRKSEQNILCDLIK